MAVSDFRVKVGLLDHPKWRRLCRSCGLEGGVGLLRLWSFCACSRFDGVLDGLGDDDIEELADWRGEHGALISALLKPGRPGGYGFLERRDDGVLVVHDWCSHNGFIASFPERSAVARMNAQARWTAKNPSRLRAKATKQHSGTASVKSLPNLPIAPSESNVPDLRAVALPRTDRSARGFTSITSGAPRDVTALLADAVREFRDRKQEADPPTGK